MNSLKYILRGLFFLLVVALLSYLNRKTGVNLGTIAKFKLETLNKIQADSLANKDKINLLVKETTKFNEQIVEDTSHAQDVIYYLILVVALFVVSELIFYIKSKKTNG